MDYFSSKINSGATNYRTPKASYNTKASFNFDRLGSNNKENNTSDDSYRKDRFNFKSEERNPNVYSRLRVTSLDKNAVNPFSL